MKIEANVESCIFFDERVVEDCTDSRFELIWKTRSEMKFWFLGLFIYFDRLCTRAA